MKKFTFTICIFQMAFSISIAQSGTLDNTFGTGGRVTTNFGSSFDVGKSVVIQNDGKILVAGSTNSGGPTFSDFGLVRYNTNGTLDNTFGTGGKTTADFGWAPNGDEGFSAALQSDGKIIVAGLAYNGTNNDFGVARFNTNGTLDNTFGTNGKVTTAIGSSDDIGLYTAIQSDGKIVVAGRTYNGSNRDMALVRYNTNGSLDNTFGAGGIVTTAIGGLAYLHSAVAIQSDGKIVLTGDNGSFVSLRYNTNGSLDNTFGSGGIVSTTVGIDGGSRSIAIQSDGKLVVTGTSFSGSQDVFALLRYNSNGTLDNSFGSSGIATTTLGPYQDDANAVAIQSDGKILVAGYTNPTGSYLTGDFALVRYNGNGSLDNSFAVGGKDTTNFGMTSSGACVALQSDGKIVVAGSKYQPSYNVFAVARYNNTLLSGIAESSNNNELKMEIYPNPTLDRLMINSNQSINNVQVYNNLGILVYSSELKKSGTEIDLSKEVAGIYFVRIGSVTKKIIKQ